MKDENRFNDGILLKDIFIGLADGEKEAFDKKFLQLFYTHNNQYIDLINDKKKFIISGRKGTGKTILSKYVEKTFEEEGYETNTLKLSDFNLQKLIDVSNRDMKSEEYSAFWKWTILIEITRLILKESPPLLQLKRNISFKKLKSFYNEIYSSDTFKDTTKSKSISGKLTAPSTEAAYTLTKNLSRSDYFQMLEKLEKLIEENLQYNKILLIYDDLDELENDVIENKGYIKNVLNLITVCNSINMKFAEKLALDLRLLIVIREDVLEMMHSFSNNLNKIISDSRVNLFWGNKVTKEPWKHPLMECILIKVRESVDKFKFYDEEELYNRLFPFDRIEKRGLMEYILDYSFGRPRDLINYLNIIKETFPMDKYFKPEHFRGCKVKYSWNFYNELKNELSLYCGKEEIDDYFGLLRDFNKYRFGYEDIKEYFNENRQRYQAVEELDEYLTFFYKFGIIGNSRIISEKRFKLSWIYRQGSSSNISLGDEIVIHYAIRKGLGI